MFQQAGANLQAAIDSAPPGSGLKVVTAYLPASGGVAVAMIGFFYCQHCHWYSVGDKCQHCDAGGKVER